MLKGIIYDDDDKFFCGLCKVCIRYPYDHVNGRKHSTNLKKLKKIIKKYESLLTIYLNYFMTLYENENKDENISQIKIIEKCYSVESMKEENRMKIYKYIGIYYNDYIYDDFIKNLKKYLY